MLREAAGNPLALLELPAVAAQPEDEPSVPGSLPLTERLERAFAARVSDLPDTTRLVLLVAALSDGDAIGEILQAAAVVAGAPVDLDAAEPAVDAALIDLDVTPSVSGTRWCAPRSGRAQASSSAGACTRRSPRRSTPIPTAACGTAPH